MAIDYGNLIKTGALNVATGGLYGGYEALKSKNPLDYIGGGVGGEVAGAAGQAGSAIGNGLSGAAGQIADWYNAPYDAAKEANLQAGQEAAATGKTAAGWAGAGIDRALDQTLPAARYWNQNYEGNGALAGPGALEKFQAGQTNRPGALEQLYNPNAGSNPGALEDLYGKTGGQSSPGALEQLYANRLGGTDLDAENQRRLGTQSINDAYAARGLQNSGAALKAIGNMNADIEANHYKQMGELAGGAQAAEQNRINSLFGHAGAAQAAGENRLGAQYGRAGAVQSAEQSRNALAGGQAQAAQAAQEGRIGNAFDRIANLGVSRAGTVQGGIQGGIDSYTGGQLGLINSQLAAANTDIQKRKDLLGLGASVGGSILGALV